MPEVAFLSVKLKELRKEKGESQVEFAANCGISAEILSLMERQRTDPKLSTLQKIAAYSNVSVPMLLSGDYDDL